MWPRSEPMSLTPTSYLVLGVVGGLGHCTSYEMKRAVAQSIGYFWSFPHSQLYAEPARLAAAGMLTEEQEQVGRRRRIYTLTEQGRAALADWLAEPTEDGTEIRDTALLKLFFGGLAKTDDVRANAIAAADVHRARLRQYEELADASTDADAGIDPFARATLELGLRFERAAVAFWEEIAADPPRRSRR